MVGVVETNSTTIGFFLVAVKKTMRWAKELHNLGQHHAEIDAFLSVAAVANLVRNKREHDDEDLGPPQKDAPLTTVPPPQGKGVTLIVEPSVTVKPSGAA